MQDKLIATLARLQDFLLPDWDFRASPEEEIEVYGDITLSHVIAVTRQLGATKGAQVLSQIPKEYARPCPHCGELTARIQIEGRPAFRCEVESHFGGERLLANLIATHVCTEEQESAK